MRWPRCWASLSSPGKSVAESVAAALEGRLRLLVFDNCEHLRDAAADLVDAILAPVGDREGLGDQPPKDRGSQTSSCGLVPSLDVGAGSRLGRRRACLSTAPVALPRASRWPHLMMGPRWWR